MQCAVRQIIVTDPRIDQSHALFFTQSNSRSIRLQSLAERLDPVLSLYRSIGFFFCWGWLAPCRSRGSSLITTPCKCTHKPRVCMDLRHIPNKKSVLGLPVLLFMDPRKMLKELTSLLSKSAVSQSQRTGTRRGSIGSAPSRFTFSLASGPLCRPSSTRKGRLLCRVT